MMPMEAAIRSAQRFNRRYNAYESTSLALLLLHGAANRCPNGSSPSRLCIKH